MHSSIDFMKIYLPDTRSMIGGSRLVAVVNLNYMFPVRTSMICQLQYGEIEKYRTFHSDSEKSSYISLLKKELREINRLPIERNARKLYALKLNYPESRIAFRCLDYLALESLAMEYIEK